MTQTLKMGRYQHYKGAYYDVLGVVTHSETEETLVLYRPCYGERGLWVRPLSMFIESVERAGKTIPRFAYLDPQPDDVEAPR